MKDGSFTSFPETKNGKDLHLGDPAHPRVLRERLYARHRQTFAPVTDMLKLSKIAWCGHFTDERGEPASDQLHSAMLRTLRLQTFPGGSSSKCEDAVRELQAREALGVYGPFQPRYRTTYGFGLVALEDISRLTLLTVYGGALLKSGKRMIGRS